jgi:tetratricopeptide (TPR) repeat protein
VLAFGLALSRAATAAEPEPVQATLDEARAAMRRGASALEEGDGEAALAEYETAKRLAPQANAPWFFAGEALERLGRFREAVASFEGYLAKDPTVSDAAKVQARIDRIRAEHFPGRLLVIAAAPGAEVAVDGGPAAVPGLLELAPGKHRLAASAPAYAPATREVDVVGDRDATITFVLQPTSRDPEPPRRDDDAPRSAFPWRTAGWATAGVGAAGFVTMLVLDSAVLRPKIDDYRNQPTKQRFDSATSLQEGILVGYIVSSVVVAAGIAVGLFAPAADSKPRVTAIR